MGAIWYFSHPGETLLKGYVKAVNDGNTCYVAKTLKQKTGVRDARIIPKSAYSPNYEQTIIRAKLEKNKQLLPEIESVPNELLAESVWFLGYPNWLGTLPRPVVTFLTSSSTKGKIIYPFCTHEGSGLGQSQLEIQQLCPQAQVKMGLAIRGSHVNHAEQAVSNWLSQSYLKSDDR